MRFLLALLIAGVGAGTHEVTTPGQRSRVGRKNRKLSHAVAVFWSAM